MTNNNTMKPYQFSQFELGKMNRLHDAFLKYKLFTVERWPSIYWGNRSESDRPYGDDENQDNSERIGRDYNIKYQTDYLGVYRHKSHDEGVIELYSDRISDCAKSISIRLEMDFDLTLELLRATVLLHELGHWFTHWCILDNKYQRQSAFAIIAQDKFITETMAQLAVIWACEGLKKQKDKMLKIIMDDLANHQPPPYYQYKKLGKKTGQRSRIQNRYLKLLDLGNIDIDYLLLQSKIPSPHRNL
jgi:hypothetical protein